MTYLVKLLFTKMDALTFPAAANYVKVISFAASLDAARKSKLPVQISELIQWTNEWLGPDFIAVERPKSVALYDQKHQRQWLDQPVQTFYEILLKNSYLSVILRKMKKKEVAIIEKMARSFSKEIENYLNFQPPAELSSAGDGREYFDTTAILWNLWIEASAEA